MMFNNNNKRKAYKKMNKKQNSDKRKCNLFDLNQIQKWYRCWNYQHKNVNTLMEKLGES